MRLEIDSHSLKTEDTGEPHIPQTIHYRLRDMDKLTIQEIVYFLKEKERKALVLLGRQFASPIRREECRVCGMKHIPHIRGAMNRQELEAKIEMLKNEEGTLAARMKRAIDDMDADKVGNLGLRWRAKVAEIKTVQERLNNMP